ncbi:GumC family protein [Microvirga sp. 2TAF3]|uniref:GumC family protein n=1 Tax=Microvirga sp. 2TAF3 TaxID=3233014 RepID=UPI003F977C9E
MTDGARLTYLRRFTLGFILVFLIAGGVWPFLPRRYEATASIILRPSDGDGRSDRAQSLRQPLDENAIQSEMDIIGSPTTASTVIAQHRLATDPEFGRDPGSITFKMADWAYRTMPIYANVFRNPHEISETELRERLQRHLTISRDRRSYTIKIGYWSSDPAKAAAMTETLLSAYLDDQVDRKRRSSERLSAWLVERVEALRAKYESSEQAVRDFMVDSNLPDSAAQASLENQLTALSKEAAEARKQSINATTQTELVAELQQTKPSVILPASSKRYPKEAAMADIAVPATWSRSNKFASLSPQATQNPETDAKNWSSKEMVLRKAMKSIRVELSGLQKAQSKLEELRHEAAIDKEVLEGAVMRLKEQTSRLASIGPDVEILARAEAPLRPAFPNPLLAFLGTFVAACVAGAAMIWRQLAAGTHRLLAEH